MWLAALVNAEILDKEHLSIFAGLWLGFFFYLFILLFIVCRFSLLTIQMLVFKLLVSMSEDCCAVMVHIRNDGGTVRTQLLQKAAPESSDLQQQICLRVKERMKMSSRAARTRSHNQVIEMSYSLAQTCREQRLLAQEVLTSLPLKG